MSIKIRHCIVIICDGCGEDGGTDEGTVHFDDVYEAIAYFHDDDPDSHDWLMTPTEHLCPACRSKRQCELVGHDWSTWLERDARGITMSSRFCFRYGCSANEIAMPEVQA